MTHNLGNIASVVQRHTRTLENNAAYARKLHGSAKVIAGRVKQLRGQQGAMSEASDTPTGAMVADRVAAGQARLGQASTSRVQAAYGQRMPTAQGLYDSTPGNAATAPQPMLGPVRPPPPVVNHMLDMGNKAAGMMNNTLSTPVRRSQRMPTAGNLFAATEPPRSAGSLPSAGMLLHGMSPDRPPSVNGLLNPRQNMNPAMAAPTNIVHGDPQDLSGFDRPTI
jgi:hypothetical protein